MTAPIRLTAFIIAGSLHLLAGAPPAEKSKELPKCGPNGRYWVHVGNGEKAYCFDGTGFAASNVPPHIKRHFEPAASSPQGAVAARPKSVTPEGRSAFPGPSLPAGGGGSGNSGLFSIRGGAGVAPKAKPAAVNLDDIMSQGAQTGYQSAAGSPAAAKHIRLPAEEFRPLAVGMSRTQVQTKLGPPHGRILNSGDDGNYEIWTYLTREGGSASIRILEGVVVSLRIPD